MTVAIETYECQETAAEPIEATQEAIELCEQLGLAGQLSLCKRGEKPADAKRSPYREMTAEERFVYRQLCPTIKPLMEYNAAPIPLRVLQIAAHFATLEIPKFVLCVWDKEQHEIKDPVLVAQDYVSGNYFSSGTKAFILARWGEVLEPFAVLMKRALQAARETLLDEARAVVREVESCSDAELQKFSKTLSVGRASF